MSGCKFWSVLLLIISSYSVFATAQSTPEHVDLFEFKTAELQQQAIRLAKTLRCPQCQNQNLVESNAQTAMDLRLTVYQMINTGSTDDEVKAYLVARFGDMVLYQPPFTLATMMLWLSSLLFILLFAVVSMRKIRK